MNADTTGAQPDAVASVVAVHRSGSHTFSKPTEPSINLLAGIGVEGDAHAGATVKHRSRVKRDPTQPNLRQVHLVMSELLDEVRGAGYEIEPGDLGENITTAGLDLIALPTGSMLSIGDNALVALTGLRNPCPQINNIGKGALDLMFIDGAEHGTPGRRVGKAGVMGVVVVGGRISAGDQIAVRYPAGRRVPMQRV